ncbi:MAG: hypothetical protein IM667_01050 [Phenylobacterium sp.]|uniref:hypothetical protein n=2 Tax=Phenylobacterium sp. TaxID=1871053 RepID=UPI0025F59A6B|nr:hypothetical protein [Phenylobacterium sp.]MCA3711346.1 hypothetical protein [Phenylobacterium sp.]MCA6239199.1 hypothetical protein [Phenylobacterium sp.]
MITVPIPLETRRAVETLTAEAETVRRALAFGGNWTTPAAAEIAELALKRLHDQIPALRLQIRQLRAKARAVRIEAEIMRRAG